GMSATAKPKLAMRPFLPADALVVAEIFRASVEELTADQYSESQREAWASFADDEEAFATRLADQLTLVGTIGGSPVGFVSLKGSGGVDKRYVPPGVARQGIGTMLMGALERLAGARGASRLIAGVSDAAIDFFKRHGFVALRRNTFQFAGEWLANTTMEKKLVAKE